MAQLTAIILVLISTPATLMAGIVLQAGEIDSSTVEIGIYAEVIL